jgi:hypothetical protein
MLSLEYQLNFQFAMRFFCEGDAMTGRSKQLTFCTVSHWNQSEGKSVSAKSKHVEFQIIASQKLLFKVRHFSDVDALMEYCLLQCLHHLDARFLLNVFQTTLIVIYLV